ncbi:protein DA1-related 1-like isoform X1 [Syzygium oleosum]|uniref:protein DA1-related 1-like isoform X1 n=1 Tax=Syzygium oleosum TaxID=219896 RepID=UPI0011D20FF2|nr:protein DA1-related 1-like isoform X1 [Syzygium oleosum]XP_030462527.1 protein DA1-related 1-like isoform X1 [Syzygium oleosum]
MGWLNKILGGSSHRKHNHGKYGGYKSWDETHNSEDELADHEREEIDYAIALSLAEEDLKGKKVIEADEDDHSEEEEQPTNVESEDDEQVGQKEDEHIEAPKEEAKHVQSQLEDDEQLAKAIQESLIVESPPRYESGSILRPYPSFFPSGYRICAGCNAEIGSGRFLSCMGSVWHPECFRCHACNHPITDYEFSVWGNRPYHKSCYKEQHHPRCDVCNSYIPTNAAGLIEYRAHPFWLQKYCPSHERDGTPRCCSCERMESRDTRYLSLDDGRKLCLECLDSAIMDTNECQPLYLEIREFYEGLNMKVEQQIPMLLVERQALNEAREGEKSGNHHMPETRGLCLSEEQCVTTIMRRPRFGSGNRIIEMRTEPHRLVRQCEVTAILILYGLPRLLTGSILAHEMMHAWLRLKGYPSLRPEVEEGICQVLAHMWLDSEIYSSSGSDVASSSSSSSSPSSSSSTSTSSKKGLRSDFEKKLGEFVKYQIESDSSAAYGDGFRLGNQAVLKYGLRSTLDHIGITGSFPL